MNINKSKYYFAKAFEPDFELKFLEVKGKFTHRFNLGKDKCKLFGIRGLFESPWIECPQYDSVISGEGNEQEKIDSAFSSSLQSLLFFARVPETKINIRFDDGVHTFDKVVFEYKNKVIGYPSSVDVVLYNDDGEICFIESKLLEIVRDSRENGSAEVGVSYFAANGVGYRETLGLSIDDIKGIGIHVPKKGFLEKPRKSKDGKQIVDRFGENKYVYSYGIKQVLSHLIGIASFRKGERAYESGDPLEGKCFKKHYYLQLFNALPGFDGIEESSERLADFKEHFEAVQRIVMERNPSGTLVDGMGIMTYQTLFEENAGRNLVSEIVRKYYHFADKA